jgi:hypothetical protein
MFAKRFVIAAGTVAGFAGLIIAGALLVSPRVHADDEHSNSDEFRIKRGLEIAPVHLTYDQHNRNLVGLGSYIVNAGSDCNGCHSQGPQTQWAPGHNPYQRLGSFFTPPAEENLNTYLGGGRDFGQIPPITVLDKIPPHIISPNLTPDDSGLPEQGASFGEFVESMRNGIDHDGLHPNCNGTTITTNCFNPPFDGNKLQVMPWPAYQNWTDRDLLAVYEYLKAIPCIASPGHHCP